MTTTLTPNGQMRKNLASQLDRLDHILDGLSDALNESVAGAVKEAVGLAVQEAVKIVLTEVLTNPELLAKVRGLNVQPEAEVKPKTTLRERLGRICNGVRGCLRAIGQVCGNKLRQVKKVAASGWARLAVIRRFKAQILVALVIATLAGTAAYFAGPSLAAAAGWFAGFVTTLSVQAGLALKRVFAQLYQAEA